MLEEIIKNINLGIDFKFSLVINNLKTKESYKINESKKVLSASIIKLFIMGETLNQANKNKISLESRINVKDEDKVPFSIISTLNSDNTYTLKDLLTLMIIQSDNTATNVLIDILGIENIKSFIESNGFNDTALERKMMDYKARSEGKDNYTSAKDVDKFLQMIYKGELINKEYSNLALTIMKDQLDKTMMAYEFYEDLTLAHKSGDLQGVKHDAGIIFTEKGDYTFSMLTYEALDDVCGKKAISRAAKDVYDYFINK